ncbi:PEP/pyruvate-binding domain-containing protein [Sinomonas mesophila]|uniref:PEP/pyruvate-binding domain-containing protein n=1 Tax=Sinomonas mesophila TaxID=1531955 RepID=UPI000986341F|nr:PEP/pyruvate-binding domain-containing protein [Sinomonas mesophila]
MPEPIVRPLASFGAGDLALAGGKGANLGELVRAGFPVPPGFVVTTAAYARMADDAGLGALVEEALGAGRTGQAAAGQGAAARLRDTVRAARVPEDVRRAVSLAYAELGGGPVAVRSSATAEDLGGAAFAGQQDTFLNVVGPDAVLDAVLRCWASLWTDRAVAYRARAGVDHAGVGIAVVVQRLVDADVAGVLFSANPVTGERGQTVVDAAAGLGEAVVSGLVTPEHWVLGPEGEVLDHAPGGRDAAVRAAASGGTVVERAPSNGHGLAPRPLLTPAQLAELARLARRAEEHFGRPQDMEWALADGRVMLVQSRPLTGLPPQPPRLDRFQRIVGPFFLEMFQVRPYPLDVTGWLRHGIVDMLHRMAGSVGVVFPDVGQLLREEDGVVVQLVPPLPRPTLRTLAAPASVLARMRRYDARHWREDPRLAAFLAEIRRLEAADLAALPWRAVVGVAEDALAAMSLVADLRVAYLPSSFLPQAPLRLALAALGLRRLGPALVAGAPTRTSAANEALAALARRAAADAELSRILAADPPSSVLARVRTEPRFAAFRAELEAFLAEFGHRETVSVVVSSAPTWRDTPETVLGIVRTLMGDAPAVPAGQTAEALAELRRHPLVRALPPLRRALLDAVERARAGMAFREDSHFYATAVLPPLRRALLELGRRLAEAGVLDTRDDVWHLTFGELAAVTDDGDTAVGGALPAWVREAYRPLVAARAEKRRSLEPFPLLDPELLFADRRTAEGALVSGTAASRGRASGPVRVVRGPEEFGSLGAGDILVCPYTNPSWTPLFQRAAAVVVDTGGLGSHAAIVAREYGIPAVMGTGRGTAVLSDGQRVVVDGSAGAVFPDGER